ncbi:MAG: hypothetical protein SVU32_08455, partial [Candidatus Nanohaloarchaea archaeon]|nr:hypothetical protein [Candidatus Nanohaloarchaea archaeon]
MGLRDELEDLRNAADSIDEEGSERFVSQEYRKYKEAEEQQADTAYEKWAETLSNLIRIDLKSFPLLEGRVENLEKNMRISRINLEQDQVGSLLVLPLLPMLLLLLPLSFIVPTSMALFLWSIPAFWAYWVLSFPGFRATVIKIKSSDEALRVILYMAMQLDITPSLEEAVKTAAEQTDGPVSRDLAKILWDTQTQKYTTIKQGISERMKLWREWSQEFVKSFEFLLDSVTRTGEGRKRMIQKGQDNMIESTKTNMQEYARALSSPVKVIHMAGIVLPLMGLIMFPLISVFLNQGKTSIGGVTGMMAFGYLIVLPLFLFFLVKRLISKRPGAYSHPSLKNVRDLPPKYKLKVEFRGNTYLLPLKPLAASIAFIIMIPGILYFFNLFQVMLSYQTQINLGQGVITSSQWENFIKNQYRLENLLPNVLQAMTIFWGISAGLVTYFLGKSYRRKKIREEIEEIEEQIDISLTELENALSKNMPIERAVYQVVEELEKIGEGDHPLHEFYGEVLNSMESRGLPFKRAIFDQDEGVIHYYPSSMLRNTMKVIANTSRQGATAMANTIRTVSEYIQNQKRVEELIEQLLDETVSQMKIQARFIAPIITAAAASMSILIVEVLFAIAEHEDEWALRV